MRVTGIDLYSDSAATPIELSLRDPSSQQPYLVKGLFGLDAEEIMPRFYGVSAASGERFHDLSMGARTVVIRLGLNPTFGPRQGVSDLRDDIYRLIGSSRTGLVTLALKNERGRVAQISGFVTKLEAPLFSKTPEVQMSIRCEDPTLRGSDEVSVENFVFDDTTVVIQDPESTAPHGFEVTMTIPEAATYLLVASGYNQGHTWEFELTPNVGFQANDVVYLNSNVGYRKVEVTRGVTKLNIADGIRHSSIWPLMTPGYNSFSFVTDAAGDNIPTITEFKFYPTFWGV